MNSTGNLNARLEAYWWLFSILFAVVLAIPIYLNTQGFPFYPLLFVYVIAAITFTRFIFLLQFTFLARRRAWKVALVFIMMPVIFLLVQELNYFQTFLDENGPAAVVGTLPLEKETSMIKYSRNVILLFGVASIISGAVLPFRLFYSVWRMYNGYEG